MAIVKLSSKNQIVVPREAREQLGLKAGDELLVIPKGDQIIVMQRPKSYARDLYGSGKGLFGRNHLRNERRSWGDK